MVKSKVSLVKCGSYRTEEVEAAVRKSVDLLGGIENFVKPDERVLLKPNLLTDARPEEGITTHPEVVRAVIRLLRSVTKNIYCGDSPSVWGEKKDADRVYDITGMRKVCGEEGAEIVYFTTPKMKRGYPLTDWLDKCDRLISIPKFKTHGFTVLTAGVKNLFGLVVGMHKMKLHRDNARPAELSRALLDIFQIKKPDLTVLDGIVAMEGQGPGSAGTLRSMNVIVSSADALSMDMVLARLMNLAPLDIPTNREAMRRGLMGPQDPSSIEIVGESLKDHVTKDFVLSKTTLLNKAPEWAVKVYKQLLRMRPAVLRNKCRACGLCQKSCPTGAISVQDSPAVIDYEKCILCLCCQEICPHAAIEVEKNLLFRILSAVRGG